MKEEDLDSIILDDKELYEHFRIVADKGQAQIRVDKFLMSRIENVSRNRLQNAAKAGNILVNGVVVKQNYRVKPNDVISIVMTTPPRITDVVAEDIPLNIIYEDADIIMINKAAGMVVHPAHGNFTGTLLNGLKFHLQYEMAKNPDIAPLLAHRIDKDTSGVLLIGKSEMAQAKLAKQFFDHSIQRKYIAIVWGDFTEDEGTIEGNIGRSLKNRKVMSVFPEGDFGKHAITHWKVIERFGYITAIECQLETGRTHQIRAHMKYIGHPLFNDANYGGDQILKGTTFTKYKQFVQNCFKILPRQGLHAKSLGFIHPKTNKAIFFDSELPSDMSELMNKWRHYGANN
ncbi:MAG: RNA pseudouridine synthase [Bacteroidetes bacterium CG2_30_33_31]|nr:MAG: RNA pseudouridine synthase [Bacteroidetes bacterium CG2_30_33_31]